MTISKISVIIEVLEAASLTVHNIIGYSGKDYGCATMDARRGSMCLRMSLEAWREAKNDICRARHRFYPLIFDFEMEDVEILAEPSNEIGNAPEDIENPTEPSSEHLEPARTIVRRGRKPKK